jgi:hypothetical protein
MDKLFLSLIYNESELSSTKNTTGFNKNKQNEIVFENSLESSCNEEEDFVFKDSASSWLENWWNAEIEFKKPTIKSRLMKRMRPLGRIESNKTNSKKLSSGVYKIDFNDFIAEESIDRNVYELNLLDATGLNLFVAPSGEVIVLKFKNESINENSKKFRLIEVGDFLIQVNDKIFEKLDFFSKAEALKYLEHLNNV